MPRGDPAVRAFVPKGGQRIGRNASQWGAHALARRRAKEAYRQVFIVRGVYFRLRCWKSENCYEILKDDDDVID